MKKINIEYNEKYIALEDDLFETLERLEKEYPNQIKVNISNLGGFNGKRF